MTYPRDSLIGHADRDAAPLAETTGSSEEPKREKPGVW